MMPGGKVAPLRIPELQCGQPEIGMAPLIDVVFLLIIFFVVTTVFPDQDGLRIEKPTSSQSAALPSTPLTVTLDAQDQIYFKGQSVSVDKLTHLLEPESLSSEPRSVLVLADRRATAQGLIRIIDACKTAGIEQVAVATVEPERKVEP